MAFCAVGCRSWEAGREDRQGDQLRDWRFRSWGAYYRPVDSPIQWSVLPHQIRASQSGGSWRCELLGHLICGYVQMFLLSWSIILGTVTKLAGYALLEGLWISCGKCFCALLCLKASSYRAWFKVVHDLVLAGNRGAFGSAQGRHRGSTHQEADFIPWTDHTRESFAVYRIFLCLFSENFFSQ